MSFIIHYKSRDMLAGSNIGSLFFGIYCILLINNHICSKVSNIFIIIAVISLATILWVWLNRTNVEFRCGKWHFIITHGRLNVANRYRSYVFCKVAFSSEMKFKVLNSYTKVCICISFIQTEIKLVAHVIFCHWCTLDGVFLSFFVIFTYLFRGRFSTS